MGQAIITAETLATLNKRTKPKPQKETPPLPGTQAPPPSMEEMKAQLGIPRDKLDRTIAIQGALGVRLNPQTYGVLNTVGKTYQELASRIKAGPTKDPTNNVILWQQSAEVDPKFIKLPLRDQQQMRTAFYEKHVAPYITDEAQRATLKRQFDAPADSSFFKNALGALTLGAIDTPAEKRMKAAERERERLYEAAERGESYRPNLMDAPPVNWTAGIAGETVGGAIPMIAGGALAKLGIKGVGGVAKIAEGIEGLGVGAKWADRGARLTEKLVHTVGAFTLPETGKVLTGKATGKDVLNATAMGFFGFTPKNILIGSTAAGIIAGFGPSEPGKKYTGISIIDKTLPTVVQTMAVRFTGERLPFLRQEARGKAFEKAVKGGTGTVRDINLAGKSRLDRIMKYDPQLELKMLLGADPTNYAEIYRVKKLSDNLATSAEQERAGMAPAKEASEIYLHKARATHEEIIAKAQALGRKDLIDGENVAYAKLQAAAESGKFSTFVAENETYNQSSVSRYVDLGVAQAAMPLGDPGNIYLSVRGRGHLEALLEKESTSESKDLLARIYARSPNVDLSKVRKLKTKKPENADYSEMAEFLSEEFVGPGRLYSEAEMRRTGMSKATLTDMIQVLIDAEAFEFLPSLTTGRPKASLQVAPKPTVNLKKTETGKYQLEYQEGTATRPIPDWFEKEITNIENSSLPPEVKSEQRRILSSKLEDFYRSTGDLLESDVTRQQTFTKTVPQFYPGREIESRLMLNAEERIRPGVDTQTVREFLSERYREALDMGLDKTEAYNRVQRELNSMDLESFTPQDSPEGIRYRMREGVQATHPDAELDLAPSDVYTKEGGINKGFTVLEGPPESLGSVPPTGPGALDVADMMQKKGIQGRIVVKMAVDGPEMKIYVEKVQGKPKQGYVLASLKAIEKAPEAGFFTKEWPAEVVISTSDNKYAVTRDRKTGKPLIRDKNSIKASKRPNSQGRILNYKEVRDILTANQGILIDVVYPDGSARVTNLTTKKVQKKTAQQMGKIANEAPSTKDLTPHIKTKPDPASFNSNRIRNTPTDGVVAGEAKPANVLQVEKNLAALNEVRKKLGKPPIEDKSAPPKQPYPIERRSSGRLSDAEWAAEQARAKAESKALGDEMYQRGKERLAFLEKEEAKGGPKDLKPPPDASDVAGVIAWQKRQKQEQNRNISGQLGKTFPEPPTKPKPPGFTEGGEGGQTLGFFFPGGGKGIKDAARKLIPANWSLLQPKKTVFSEIQTRWKIPAFRHMMNIDDGMRVAQSYVQSQRKLLVQTMEALRNEDLTGLLPYVLQTDANARKQIQRQHNLSPGALDIVPDVERLFRQSLGDNWRKLIGSDFADHALGETSPELGVWMEKGQLDPKATDLLDMLPNAVYSRARMYVQPAIEGLNDVIKYTQDLPETGAPKVNTIISSRALEGGSMEAGIKTGSKARDVLISPEHWLPKDTKNYIVSELVKYKARVMWTLNGDRPNAETFIRKLFTDNGVPVDNALFSKFLPNYLLLSYAGTMPGRLGLVIKQLTQPMITTYPLVGGMNYARGMKFAWSKEGKALAKELRLDEFHGIPLEHYLAGTESYRAGGMTVGEEAAFKLRQVYNVGMYPFNRMEYANRRTSAGVGYATIKEHGPAFLKGDMSLAEFRRETGMIFLEQATQNDILQHLVIDPNAGIKPNLEQAAKTAAKHYSDDSHWIYSAGHTAEIFTSWPGRFLGQFGTWPTNYLRFLYRGISTGDFAANKAFVARWLGINASLVAVGQQVFGIDPRGWLMFGPMQYAGGPGASLFTGFHLAAREGYQGEQGKKMIKDALTALIPFYNSARDFSYLIDMELDPSGPSIQKRYEDTPTRLARFAGMRRYEK